MNEQEIRADERERVASIIDDLVLTLISGDDSEGTALTAAVLQRAAEIVRGAAA